MKKLIMVSVAIVMMAGITTRSSAQSGVTINPTAGAELVQVLTITNSTPLYFGRIGITAGTAGTVIMGTDGLRTPGAGTTIIINTGITPRTVAKFDLTGTTGVVYTISIPSPIVVTTTSGTGIQTMDIDALKINVDGAGEVDAAGVGAKGTFVSGASSFLMSGTLNIAATQATGIYAGTYHVTVDFQ
jgi:hypothetical protein